MSKKKSKKSQLQSIKSQAESKLPSPTASGWTVTPIQLEELRQRVRAAIDATDWDVLLKLGQTPLSEVVGADHSEAKTFILRIRVWSIVKNSTVDYYSLTGEERTELKKALVALATHVKMFYRMPEFDLYWDVFQYDRAHAATIIDWLCKACLELEGMHRVQQLREQLIRLRQLKSDDEELTEVDLALLEAYPNPDRLLGDIYIHVAKDDKLQGDDRLTLKVLQLEVQLMCAEPPEIPHVTSQIRLLPCPTPAELISFRSKNELADYDAPLTPDAWAFMAELAHVQLEGLPSVLNKYPREFACGFCDAVRLLFESIVAPVNEIDNLLAEATERLAKTESPVSLCLGGSLVISGSDGVTELNFRRRTLHFPVSITNLLQRAAAITPDLHPRKNEYRVLDLICSVGIDEGLLEGDDDVPIDTPGLGWLCDRSLTFQIMASNTVHDFFSRVSLLVNALYRLIKGEMPLPKYFYVHEYSNEELTTSQAVTLLESMERLASVSRSMDAEVRGIWQETVAPIFRTISKLDASILKRALPLARIFEEDLLINNEYFRIAYLEQMAGDPKRALSHYLVDLNFQEEVNSAAINNLKILLKKSNSLSEVNNFVAQLTDAVKTNSHTQELKKLLADTKARQTELNEKEQFERTAVNRWPSITAPARKLLSVLDKIQRFGSHKELGEYAGMTEEWAGKHYKKLVETGMLLMSDSGYSINPHIKTFLDLESQHAVVGRIIRSQGTSAVKQVFNSQREFTIYQVMVQLCPNHLVFPNCALQSIMSYDRMRELSDEDDFGYYLRASVDIVVVSSSTYLPMLAIEVDSVWHATERQQKNDDKKDRLFAAAGIPFMRLQPVGSPSENVIRGQVAEHLDDLIRSLREDLPGYDQTRVLLQDLSGVRISIES
nr:DUF2726 domain-containing protein [uncultured Undibacterium sp.]